MKTIEELLQEATQKIQDVKDSSSLNDLRVLYLGKKGPVQELMKGMKDLSKEEKPIFGQKVNQLKQDLSKMIEEKKEQLAALEMQKKIEWIVTENSYCMLEVVCSTTQIFEPKSAVKKLQDGSLYSPPLEDLAPFLEHDELKKNMYIKMWDER